MKEENDFKELKIMNKMFRDERMDKFEDKWLEKIVASPKVAHYQLVSNKYIFWFTDGNIIDFFPKANKLLIRRQNKWVKPALTWVIRELELTNA